MAAAPSAPFCIRPSRETDGFVLPRPSPPARPRSILPMQPASSTGALPAPPEELVVAPFPASRSSSPRGLLRVMPRQAPSSPATSFVGSGRDRPDLLVPKSGSRCFACFRRRRASP
ncbi:hypothetical protein ACQJBY_023436 [Aegilops geniculata]